MSDNQQTQTTSQTAPQDKRTATQRIQDLENIVRSFYQTLDTMSRDTLLMKEGVKLLNNKLDAVVKIINSGGKLEENTISSTMLDNNVQDLKSRVDNLIAQNILVSTDQVDDLSFVVGQETDSTGEIKNPRIQFTLSSLPQPIQEKLKGAKVGDTLSFEENKLSLNVLEIYEIQTPQQPPVDENAQQAAPATPTTETQTPAASSTTSPDADASLAVPTTTGNA